MVLAAELRILASCCSSCSSQWGEIQFLQELRVIVVSSCMVRDSKCSPQSAEKTDQWPVLRSGGGMPVKGRLMINDPNEFRVFFASSRRDGARSVSASHAGYRPFHQLDGWNASREASAGVTDPATGSHNCLVSWTTRAGRRNRRLGVDGLRWSAGVRGACRRVTLSGDASFVFDLNRRSELRRPTSFSRRRSTPLRTSESIRVHHSSIKSCETRW